ncbi:hypothetical protein KDK82_0262 [Delftia sp. K82]|nr:hypothetical protein KDK82_0262 [Delftia sp. K82]
MAFGLGCQPAAAIGKARHFEAGALLTRRDQHGRWDREHVGVGVAQLHVHTTDGCRRGQRHGHGIRPVDTDRGAAGDKAQRRQIDDFDLRFGKAQRGVACGDAGSAQGAGLYLQVRAGLPRRHGDPRHGRCHRGHAAGDVHYHALCRCRRVERDPQHGDHAGTEPEPGGLDGQGRLTYLDEALLHQVRNADHAPNDLGANGARRNCNGIQRVALCRVSLAGRRGRKINADGRAAVVIEGRVVDGRGSVLDDHAAAVFDGDVVQQRLGAARAGRHAPLAPVPGRRGCGRRGDEDGLVRRAHGLQRTFLEQETGARGHAQGHPRLDGERCIAIEHHVALHQVRRLAGTQHRLAGDGAAQRGLGPGGRDQQQCQRKTGSQPCLPHVCHAGQRGHGQDLPTHRIRPSAHTHRPIRSHAVLHHHFSPNT